jgi:REP element-mobilizing transposase RayT
MPNTYTQIYIHLVFAVKDRASLIPRDHRAELQKYITGIVSAKKNKLIAIENEPDHIHILVGLQPSTAVSDLVRDIKANSSRWLAQQSWMKGHFEWQEGFGAFSHSRSQLDDVIRYIMTQEEHHRKRTFLEEFEAMLKAFGVEYDPKYMFHPVL